MQVVKPSSPAPKLVRTERFSEIHGELSQDFCSKLKIAEKEEEDEENKRRNLEKSWWNQDDKESQEGEDEGEEFSFARINVENSPISAEEAFEDGQIRPVYPLFNRNLLLERDDSKGKAKALNSPIKKLFVQSEESTAEESEPMGPYCSWSSRTVEEASPRTCRKSNSTGFSKLWRFKDLVRRSNSDGKDAFVFLSNGDGSVKSQSSSVSSSSTTVGKRKEKTEKKMKTKSAHEKLYMRNRAMREEGKRKSYIPYKHVGFFTNVNGLSRNVHPY